MNKNSNVRGLIGWILIFLTIILLLRGLQNVKKETVIPYSTFKEYVKQKTVKNVKLSEGVIAGVYTDASGKEVSFRTQPLPVSVPDAELIKELANSGIKYEGESDRSWLGTILINFGPVILFLALWFLMLKYMQGGGKQVMAFGRSKAKLQGKKENSTTFNDVAGCDEVKEELKEIIEFLKDPAKFRKLGGKIPKGVLLFGAPGTGKTLLAKAVAGEAGVPFFSSSGSEFVEMFVGVGASRVRDLFDRGRKNAPCLLFIDEIDAVGRHRFAGIGGGHDEREQTLNQLLVEMDGFDTKEGVILIAATNRPDVLDPALLRPGRFDRHIIIQMPGLKDREEILKVHSKKVKSKDNVDMKIIARRTPGFVGADLANVINESALLAARKNKEAVEMEDLEESIERVLAGPARKSRMISEKEKRIIAFHEAGHTLVAVLVPNADPVHKVSIIPRGPALGYTMQLPLEDRYLTTKTEISDRLIILLGGRTAESLMFGEVTTGAKDDLSKATDIVYKMVCEYGMSNKLGPVILRKREEEMFLGRDIMSREKMYSEKTAQLIDEEVKRIIEFSAKQAAKMLAKNKDKLIKLAEKLIEKEVLESDAINQILGLNPPEQPEQKEAVKQ